MSFSAKIPDKLLEHPNVLAFVNILEALQSVKTEIISESLHVDNFAVLMNKKWILKKLEEFGVTDIPLEYPVQVLLQLLLNVDTVCRTRGSRIGIELYCSLLSLGEVTVDDRDFYVDTSILLLDSINQGYLVDALPTKTFYLCDNSDINPEVPLYITVRSKFFNGDYPIEANVIKGYLESTIDRQIGFGNNKVHFYYQPKEDFYFHKLLNPYFV